MFLLQSVSDVKDSVRTIGLEPTIIILLLLGGGVLITFFLKWFRELQKQSRADLLKTLEERRTDLATQEKSISTITQALRDLSSEIHTRQR